jgi:FkbM family methyltransferase
LKLKYSDDFAFIFIDCGANIGLASAYIQTQFAKAKFVGIEPSFDNIEMAQLNVKYEKLFHRALTSKNKQLVDLFSPVGDPGQWAFRVHNDETGNIETMDLAALLEELKPWDQLPFILKVDIEGSEFEVFRNAPATIVQQFDIIIVEIHDFIDEPSSLIHLICSHGYSTFPMGEYWFFKRI